MSKTNFIEVARKVHSNRWEPSVFISNKMFCSLTVADGHPTVKE